MKLEEQIGKIYQVKIIEKKPNYYISQVINNNILVFVKKEDYLEDEEILNTVQRCLVTEIAQDLLVGEILTNRKFEYDITKIGKKLESRGEFNNIKDIYLAKRLKIDGKISGIYLVDEGDIAKIYLDTKEIGTYIKKMHESNILFKENTIENQLASQIKDVVQSIDLNKKEISLLKEREKEKHLIEQALGLEQQRSITRIATIDLKQKIVDTQEKNNKKILDENKKEIFKEEKKESTIKDVNIKQEVKANNMVTDMKTLGKLLKDEGKLPQIEGKEFEKIGIIESDQKDNLRDKDGKEVSADTTRYSMVAIAKDGTVVPLDIEKDHAEGNNPREMNYQVTQKGEVQKDDVLSRFKVGNGTLAVKNGQYGEIKVYHSPRKTIGGKDIEGNKSLDRELETDNVWRIKKDERDLAGDFKDGYRSVEEGYQEAQEHADKDKKVNPEDLTIEDIDGDKNTKSHVHDNINYEELASKWGYYKDGNPNAEKAQKLFEEKRKENPEKETKEIIEMVTEDLEEEMNHSRDCRY